MSCTHIHTHTHTHTHTPVLSSFVYDWQIRTLFFFLPEFYQSSSSQRLVWKCLRVTPWPHLLSGNPTGPGWRILFSREYLHFLCGVRVLPTGFHGIFLTGDSRSCAAVRSHPGLRWVQPCVTAFLLANVRFCFALWFLDGQLILPSPGLWGD